MGEADRRALEAAADDPALWFLRKKEHTVCRLTAGKFAFCCMCWQAMKPREKPERQPAEAEALLGTMDADMFVEQWLKPVCQCLQAVELSRSTDELEMEFRRSRESFPAESRCSDEDLAADASDCCSLLGRRACMVLDGARCHTSMNPWYLRREGPGSIYGPRGAGRDVEGVGMKKDTLLNYLLGPAGGVPTEADEAYREALAEMSVLDLRKMVDADAPKERLRARSVAGEHGVALSLTPPYAGKWLNAVELVWSLAKRRFRALPQADRRSPAAAVAACRRILQSMRQERWKLLHLYLPSWRWVYAVLRAACHGERVLCRGRRILLPELQSAVRKYTAALRRGEADDLDAEAPEAELDMQAPAALSSCRLPSAEATGEADLEAWSEAEVLPACPCREEDAAAGAEGERRA
jgi:hypothetical protein